MEKKAENNECESTGMAGRRWRTQLSAPHAIILGGMSVALVMVCLCAVALYQGRLDAVDRARDTSRNLALIAERDIERNFELYQLSLQAVVDGMNDPEARALPMHLRRQVLFDRAATAKYLGAMLVLDAKGNIVLDSASDIPRKGNFADRKYFTTQRDNPNAGLFISDPYASRLRNGAPGIALSRRISNPDGSFAGVAVIAIDLEYFHHLFAGLSLGPHGVMVLIGKNGIMIMRQPYAVRNIGRDVSHAGPYPHYIASRSAEGSFTETAVIDHVRRFYVFRRFPTLPLIVAVAEAEQDIYAAWRRRALTIGSLMVLFSLVFIAISFLLAAQLRRRMRAESELQLLARTDGLTGLRNRRTLGEVLEQEWRRARRMHGVFSLLFVDIDRFKAYNDTYGHQAGDDALASVARCIEKNIRRPADTAARYGGEEFIVVLPDTPPAGAARLGEQIRAAISDLAIEHAGSEYGRLTASIGTASWGSDADGDVSAVIKVADMALYQAKATGRNKVAQLCET